MNEIILLLFFKTMFVHMKNKLFRTTFEKFVKIYVEKYAYNLSKYFATKLSSTL